MSNDAMSQSRLDREREFHDTRFHEETRGAQARYYKALNSGFDRYWHLIAQNAQGKAVLEYGCAEGTHSMRLSPRVSHITGIDISGVGIEKARLKAANAGLMNTRFEVMDAENLALDDESFDLIFGSGILHHLDVKRAYGELSRVLRPGGVAVFIEPLGHNPVINLYRRMTPEARTPDEHPLLRRDIELARRYFTHVDTEFFGLTQLASTLLRPDAVRRAFNPVTAAVDRVLLQMPLVKWQAWATVISARKAVPGALPG